MQVQGKSSEVECEAVNNDSNDRGHWGSRAEFLLSCIAMSVGLGNIWRFPYLAYKNGGAVFIFAYVILLILVGLPMYVMEVTIGQFASISSLEIWRCFPIAKGIGWAMIILCINVAIYSAVIISYTIIYLAGSFASQVPWKDCFSWWGPDENCYVRTQDGIFANSTEMTANLTNVKQTASEQYWQRYVLHIHESNGIGDLGEIRWQLILCQLFCWTIVFFCVFRGIKSSGKVVYFTATFPYITLILLLIRGVALEGALTGLKFLFVPQWDKLLNIEVWAKAAEQMLLSLSVSSGNLIVFGSYNSFRKRSQVDAMIASILGFVVSLIGSVAVFSILGFISTAIDIPIEKVASKGPGLVFVAYPEAIAMFPLPQLWSVLLFFMLFTLGLGGQFSNVGSILSNLYDQVPSLRKRKILITFLACLIGFLLGLPCVTNGGQYVLNIMDHFGSGFVLIIIGFSEIVAFIWMYGIRNFSKDIEFMLGFQPNIYWKFCWAAFCPISLVFLIVMTLYKLEPAKYGDYVYPQWAQVLGWCLTLFSVIPIPLCAIAELIRRVKKGDILDAFRPTDKWGPSDPVNNRNWREFKGLTYPKTDTNSLAALDNPGFSISTVTLEKPFDTRSL